MSNLHSACGGLSTSPLKNYHGENVDLEVKTHGSAHPTLGGVCMLESHPSTASELHLLAATVCHDKSSIPTATSGASRHMPRASATETPHLAGCVFGLQAAGVCTWLCVW